MATTYLTLANETLRELNEVQLTSSNFSDAVGIQAFVKESINRALNDIANQEPQLPFFAAAASGETDPFYGNVTVATVKGTRWYTLKSGSSSITTDYASIDWDDFYITTISVSGESAPYVSRGLKFISLSDWRRYLRDSENSDDADGQVHGEPRYVIRSPDHRKFGLSPIPDKVYKVWFFAYDLPTELSAHSDAVVFPDIYKTVILSKARYYTHQFKDNPQMAAFALEDFKKGLKSMRENLIGTVPTFMSDDRVRFD